MQIIICHKCRKADGAKPVLVVTSAAYRKVDLCIQCREELDDEIRKFLGPGMKRDELEDRVKALEVLER